MCGGIAVRWRTVSKELTEQFGLVTTKIGTEERVLHFSFRDPLPRLPAYYQGKLGIYLWGNRDDKESHLPKTGWCKVESLEAGKWDRLHPESVEIPAIMGREEGVWFPIEKGMKGILVKDEREVPHVFMLTQTATPEYLLMTKHERMPVFLS